MSEHFPSLITLREIHGYEEMLPIYPLVKQQNTDLDVPHFELYLQDMVNSGYRCLAAYMGQRMVGVCGFWVGTRFWCGPYIDLDNVIVDEHIRSSGIGRRMVEWVEDEGRKLGCTMAVLDSYTTSARAHRFYFREGYSVLGFHFVKRL